MRARVLSTGNRCHLPIAVLLGLVLVAGCGGPDDGDADADGESSGTVGSTAPVEPTAPTTPAATAAPAFDPLVGVGEVELVGDGFRGAEGPQWLADDGVLVFTDNTNIRVVDGDEIALFGVRSVGIGLAVDPEGLLIAADPQRRAVTRTEADGAVTSLAEARTFVTTGGNPDGVTVDSGGNVFVATVDGIEVFAPDGSPWGVIPVPQQAANSAFGGADGRTLYITAQTGLYRVTLANPGPY